MNIVLPEMLYERIEEADERVDAVTRCWYRLMPGDCAAGCRPPMMTASGQSRSCFMHGYRVHDHEKRIAKMAREIGFGQISASHETSSMIKFVGRGDTTVADAYLSPILRRYIDQIAGELGDTSICR